MLLIVLDTNGTDGREPIADYKVLINELKLYMPGLARKPVLVAANKMDEPDAPENLKTLSRKVKESIYPISCVSDDGFAELKQALLREVLSLRAGEAKEVEKEA